MRQVSKSFVISIVGLGVLLLLSLGSMKASMTFGSRRWVLVNDIPSQFACASPRLVASRKSRLPRTKMQRAREIRISSVFVSLCMIAVGACVVAIGYKPSMFRDGYCTKCGYDLRGNVSGVCSECGMAIGRKW